MKILFLILFLIFPSKQKLSGFEENIEKIWKSSDLIFKRVDDALEIIDTFFVNIDSITKNELLFNQNFLTVFNEFIENLTTNKLIICRNLKLMLKNVYYIHSRDKSFDLFLRNEFSSLV